MSFIVSFQGQFRPYSLPDLSHYGHIHNIAKATDPDDASFDKELKGLTSKGKVKSQVTHTYLKQEKDFQKEKVPHHARDLMTKSPTVLFIDDNVSSALETFKKKNISHLPVLNQEGVLCGIVSDRDTLRRDLNDKISSIMSPEVLTCLEETRIQEISKIMLHEKISAIPIINHQYQLTGILTKSDILKFMTKIISINELI